MPPNTHAAATATSDKLAIENLLCRVWLQARWDDQDDSTYDMGLFMNSARNVKTMLKLMEPNTYQGFTYALVCGAASLNI